MNQHFLALLQPSGVKERSPCRDCPDRNRGGMNMVNGLRLERRFCFLRHDVLRVSSVAVGSNIGAGIDFIALFEFRDTGTHCVDHTGDVPAWNERQGERNVILHVARPDFPVERIHRSRTDSDQ